MPCVSLNQSSRNTLASLIVEDPSISVEIDLVNSKIKVGDKDFLFDIREGARDSLLNGKWDPIDELLSKSEDIEKVSTSLIYK